MGAAAERQNVIPMVVINKRFSFGILIAVLVAAGCSSSTEPVRTVEFEVLVDSVQAPDSVQSDEPLLVRVWAVVGPDLCYKFSRFNVVRDGDGFNFTIIGEHTVGPVACADAVSEMRGRGVALNPPYPAKEFSLTFRKRDGNILRHFVVRLQHM